MDSISHLSHAESTLLLSASPLRCYRKSESVNEYARRVSSIDRSGVIDGAYVSTSSDSESESEVDNPKKCRKKLIAPKFALNKIVTPRNIIKPNNNLLISVNPDEPTSSLSETATWDSYQVITTESLWLILIGGRSKLLAIVLSSFCVFINLNSKSFQ